MSDKVLFSADGYRHKTAMRKGYKWLPLFTIVLFISSYLEKIRYILYFTAVAGIFQLIISKIKKEKIDVLFYQSKIVIGDLDIPLTTVSNFHICLPLKELIMLRLEVKGENIAVYITKQKKDQILNFLQKANFPDKRIGYDAYLQYGHNLSAFVVLAISTLVDWIYKRLKYGF